VEGAVTHLERRAVGYVGALVLAEILVAAVDPRLGALLHALLLVVLLQHGARAVLAPEQRLYWSLALVPLLRLLSLSLPLSSIPGVWRFAVVAVPLLLATVVAARATGLGPAEVGLRWRWRDVPLQTMVAVGGLPLGLMEYVLLKPPPLATELSLAALWVPATVLILATGLTEEIIFRGLLQRTSADVLGPWLGPLLITCLWTALHVGLGSWPALVLTFLAGGLFAFVAGWTGSIWGVGLSHGLTNVTAFLIAPLLLDPLAF
jgi:membrane protease YdiL (CAAX protease family)